MRYAATIGIAVLFTGLSMGEAQSVAVGVRPESVKLATVTVDVTNVPLATVIELIARQAGLRPFWNERIFDGTTRVTVHVRNVPADEAFAKALAGSGMKAAISATHVEIVRDATLASAIQGSISGRIVDAKTHQPLRGAAVTLDDVIKGTTSNDGTFRFSNVTPGAHTVQIRMLGYVKAVRSVTVADGQTAAIDVALEKSISALEQVVVTGTIVATELKAVPSAITVITAEQIEQRGITKIDQLFRGDVPGLFALNLGSGNPLDTVFMFSRGATKLPASAGGDQNITNPIKTYVDGVELVDSKYLNQIDPKSIERIEILTGPQASTIYGSNAINGVMQIFTKRGTNVARPQVQVALSSGLIQNNFSSALTPTHDHSAQVSGMEGRWSYTVGGSWSSLGRWTPAIQSQRASGYGSGRMQIDALTADASARVGQTKNLSRGTPNQIKLARLANGDGWNGNAPLDAASFVNASTLLGQTFGATITYRPMSWWTHELGFGTDVTTTETIYREPSYAQVFDSVRSISQAKSQRTSQRYVSTLRVPFASTSDVTVIIGGDHWRTTSMTAYGDGTSLTGALQSAELTRVHPDKNMGGFVQGQLGFLESLFLTYGLRAEWNPNYGDEVQPNLAPRYGVSYTHAVGAVTGKLRASYGRSTRPPATTQKFDVPATFQGYIDAYGPYNQTLGNPELGPEYQQGGEGGVELYFGNRGSLVVTRYNQTVDALIFFVRPVDSVRSLAPLPIYHDGAYDADGFGYNYQGQNLNIGSIRNQGWELQGFLNAGPLTTHGTYSWTKSRITGMAPEYRDLLFQRTGLLVGAPFQFLPEHTWSMNVTYARQATTLTLALNGTGTLVGDLADLQVVWGSSTRLQTNNPRVRLPNGLYKASRPGYTMADLIGSQRISSRVEGTLQIQNLGNFYQSDYSAYNATIGRQTRIGIRLR